MIKTVASLLPIALLAAGCSTPPPAEPTEPTPTVEPPPVASAPPIVASAAPPIASASAAPEAAPTTVDRPASCVGTGFDLDKLFSKAIPVGAKVAEAERVESCGYTRDISDLAVNARPDAIEITVDVQPSPLAPGATAKLVATFKNITDKPRTVAFSRGCDDPLLNSNLWRADNDRADLEKSDIGCGVSRGCMSQYVVVTLEPGGTATASGKYAAKLMRIRQDECKEIPVGAVAAGTYELRTMTPLFFREAGKEKGGSYREARRPLDVGKKK